MNALFLPFRHGVPLIAEVERLVGPSRVMVPSTVLAELDRLVRRSVAGATAARAFAARFPILPAEGLGDAAILASATAHAAHVVTADRDLRRRLVVSGTTVLFPQDRARLGVERGRTPRASANARSRRRPPSGNG
ncbi:MAG: hypothetical protein ACREDK_03725 [Thermoplasmata archaeon]